MKIKINIFKSNKGTTFVELLLYVAIFLILTPILLTVSINAVKNESKHQVEKQINTDSQFTTERIYDLVASAKRVDVANTEFDTMNGRLTLIMPDDSTVSIYADPETKSINITENGISSKFSAEGVNVESLYFEKIDDEVNDEDIVLGVTMYLKLEGNSEYNAPQEYITSVNLEKGDYDEDNCPDYKDVFPKDPNCCGDADDDGTCDEMDNCILVYNPFQEDFDNDTIGDACDASTFFPDEGGGGGTATGLAAFNCSTDQQLIDIINQDPPLRSAQLKNILISSTPLTAGVLNYLIDNHENTPLKSSHLKNVLVANTKLPAGVLDNMNAMPSSSFKHSFKRIVNFWDNVSNFLPILDANRNTEVAYDIDLENPVITFSNPDPALNANEKRTDIFMITSSVEVASVDVTITSNSQSETSTLNEGDSIVDSLGFGIELAEVRDAQYAFAISSVSGDYDLESVSFDFGEGSMILNPSGSEYNSVRYVYYCEGGCDENCGDVGTGIVTNSAFTDLCYTHSQVFPEWCSKWNTFTDDDSENPAYIGATTVGTNDLYWEKEYKTILSTSQLNALKSITVGGEVAYQSTTEFFCDTLSASCPMNGELNGMQDVDLYNWNTNSWETIGNLGLDGTISDQQSFEVKYDNSDLLKFVGGRQNRQIKSRIRFHWDGIQEEYTNKAPSFMLIDYLTVHLKW